MTKIAFIGVGVMGKSMVRHLHKHYDISIYTRTKAKVQDLIDEGIQWKDSIKECIEDCDVIMTMVGFPQDVKDIYYQPNGIFNHAKAGAVLIDFTTSSPQLAKQIYQDAKNKNLHSLDAPVSGGDIGAKNATLSIMVGGDQDIYQRVYPIFQCLASSIHYVGKPGLGQHTKMANQIAIAGNIAGTVEAIHYARSVGLDTSLMMECISQGAASSWQLSHNGQAILDYDFEPGFYIKHFIKDMKIAQNEMESKHQQLEVLNQVLDMYLKLNENDNGTQALIHYYEED